MLDIGVFFEELGSNVRNMIDGVQNTQASSQRISHISEKQVPAKWGTQPGAATYRKDYSSTLNKLGTELKLMEADLATYAADLRKAADDLKEADKETAAKAAQVASSLDQAVNVMGAPQKSQTATPAATPYAQGKPSGYAVPSPS